MVTAKKLCVVFCVLWANVLAAQLPCTIGYFPTFHASGNPFSDSSARPPPALQVFAGAKKAGYLPTDRTVRIDHVGFGLVMGEDGKKFRSRSGDVSGGEGWVPVAVRQDWWAGWWGWCVWGWMLFAGVLVVRWPALPLPATYFTPHAQRRMRRLSTCPPRRRTGRHSQERHLTGAGRTSSSCRPLVVAGDTPTKAHCLLIAIPASPASLV